MLNRNKYVFIGFLQISFMINNAGSLKGCSNLMCTSWILQGFFKEAGHPFNFFSAHGFGYMDGFGFNGWLVIARLLKNEKKINIILTKRKGGA